MGSCLSNAPNFNANATLDGFLHDRPRPTKRRSFASHQSNSSSGIFSLYSSPSRSQCTSTPASTPINSKSPSSSSSYANSTNSMGAKGKLRKSRLSRGSKNTFLSGKEFDRMSIIDDFGELQLREELNNQSRGYFTKSISSQSADDPDDVNISKSNANLRYTRDTSGNFHENVVDDAAGRAYATYDRPDSPNGCKLEMEMFMMSSTRGIIGKTSSPMALRRDDRTYDVVPSTVGQPGSNSYNKWRNFLESTPAYMVRTMSDIPEAVAGHFCPNDFPAFIDMNVECSEAKRFKLDADESDAEHYGQFNTSVVFHQPMTSEL